MQGLESLGAGASKAWYLGAWGLPCICTWLGICISGSVDSWLNSVGSDSLVISSWGSDILGQIRWGVAYVKIVCGSSSP